MNIGKEYLFSLDGLKKRVKSIQNSGGTYDKYSKP